jgi:hypothetical protein
MSTNIRLSILLGPSVVGAAPIQWTMALGGNNHWYEFVATPKTWDAARFDAKSRTHMSRPGYLATVTSKEEYAFVAGLLGNGFAYLGGSDASVEGEWRWIDGPEAGQLF